MDQAKIDPTLRHQGLRGVKGAENMDFWQYAEETLKDKPDLLAKVLGMVSMINEEQSRGITKE